MTEGAIKTENQVLFLLKTMKSEYLESTIKMGRFCFNHPSAFNKWEDKEAAQYDKWDSHLSKQITNVHVFPITGYKDDGFPIYGAGIKMTDSALLHLQSGVAKHSPICCFRAIMSDEVSFEKEECVYDLGDDAKRIRDEFGHDAYVMILANPFLERIKQRVGCYSGLVVYKDVLNQFPQPISEEHEEIVEQLFRKDERFSWQKEFRIALAPTNESPVFLEIGSIEDIAKSGMLSEL